MARFAQEFGYQVLQDDASLWLRRMDRVRGHPARPAVRIGPTIKSTDIHSAGTYEFLGEYRANDYGAGQGNLVRYTTDSLRASLARRLESLESFRRWHALTHPLTFAHPIQLRSLLEDSILPAFFERDPDGVVQVLQLNPDVDRQFAVLRATYAMSHYPIDLLRASDRGFATLNEWDSASPVDYLEAVVSILQASTYPYMPMFHGGPFGLYFCFLLSTPEKVELDVFPRSWMHWTRSGSEFGTERLDHAAALRDPASEFGRRLAHRRYLANAPLPIEGFHALLVWSVEHLSSLLNEVSDPANFERDGNIDFVCGLEHSLSMLRLFRRAIYILASEEPPSGKLTVFEMADVLQELRGALRQKDGAGLFKRLFNPTEALALCQPVLALLPSGASSFFQSMAETVYGELRSTVAGSVWIQDKVKDGRVLVRSRDLGREEWEGLDDFVGTIVRALRNTHHGYFSRLDNTNRPSRYLAMSTGNLPDSLSVLALIWVLCVLGDAEAMTGWKPLGIGVYD